MIATIKKEDNDYILRLPSNLFERMKLRESEAFHVFEEYGRIILQKPAPATIANDTTRKTIDELFEDYDGDYEPIHIDWGNPVGNEVW